MNELKDLNDMYKALSIQVASQHEFKLRQIDENRKLSGKVDELEETINRIKDTVLGISSQNV